MLRITVAVPTEGSRGGVGTQGSRVRPPERHAQSEEHHAGDRGQHLGLIEEHHRAVAFLPPHRVGHHRRRADAEHLRHRQDDERQIAGDRHARDGLLAEPADPVQIDEEVQRLKDHRHQHETGGLQQMSGDGSRSQVLHSKACPRAAYARLCCPVKCC
jgi:hypothetical protein